MRLSATIPANCCTEITAAVINMRYTTANQSTSSRYVWYLTDTALRYTECDRYWAAITWATDHQADFDLRWRWTAVFSTTTKKSCISMAGTQNDNKHRCYY